MPSVAEILDVLSEGCEALLLVGDASARVDRPAPLPVAGPGAMTFARRADARTMADLSATLAFVPRDAETDEDALAAAGVACLVLCDNPRLEFARAAGRFFSPPRPTGVDQEAHVSPEASLGRDVYVGPGATVGAATIGDGCVVHAGAHIGDGVTLGSRCTVWPGAVLGADGFGFERDEEGRTERFPHFGGIVVGDDVEIGANACVDRGALADTIIGDRVRLDNLVHVAHNVRIGADTMIAACAEVSGSCRLGERVWVGPSACISDGLEVGDDAFVTIGAVVTRNVKAGQKVTGNFAVDHERFLHHLRTIK